MRRFILLLNVVLVISLLVGGCTTSTPEVIEGQVEDTPTPTPTPTPCPVQKPRETSIAGTWMPNDYVEIEFTQDGQNITGRGYKIAGGRQEYLKVSGKIAQNEVDVTFDYEITSPPLQKGNKGSVKAKLDGDWIIGIWEATHPEYGFKMSGFYRLKKKGSTAQSPKWIYYKGIRVYPNTFIGPVPTDGIYQKDVTGCPDCTLKQWPNGKIINVYCAKHTEITFDDGRVTNLLQLREDIKALKKKVARRQAKIDELNRILAIYDKIYSLRIRVKKDIPLKKGLTAGGAVSFDIIGKASVKKVKFESRFDVPVGADKAVVRVSVDGEGKAHIAVGYNRKLLPFVDGVIRLEDGTEVKIGADIKPPTEAVRISGRVNVTKLLDFLYEATLYYCKPAEKVEAEETATPPLLVEDEVAILLDQTQSLMASGHYSETVVAAQRLVDIDPESIEGYFHRGLAYFNLNEPEMAILDFSYALEISEEPQQQAFLYSGLGHLYLDISEYIRESEPEIAARCFEQAAEVWPDNRFLRAYIGWAYYLAGEYERAREAYYIALEDASSEDLFQMIDNAEQYYARHPELGDVELFKGFLAEMGY